jgi:hypothetical protein
VDLAGVFASATDLATRYARTVLCRSLDVLHVAAALHLRCSALVSADERQLQLAHAVGLEVVDLGKRRARARRR